MRPTKRDVAVQNKMSHAFMHGLGYVFVGPLQPRNRVSHGMRPASGSDQHGSLHWVDAPQGKRILLRWDAKTGHWEHPHNPAAGNRLGWTPEYLASWNWKYKLAHKSEH